MGKELKVWNLTPTSLGEAIKFGEMLAGSGMVPENYINNPAGVVAACEQGSHLGFTAMQSLQSIAVINGLPSLWGDALPALAMAHPKFVGIDETFDESTMTATCTVERQGMKPQTRTFSWADAERAKLTGKNTYQQYPQRMLKARARAWAIRDVFPDALKGCQVVEEVRDYPANAATDEDYRNVVADAEVSQAEPAEPDKPKSGMDALAQATAVASQTKDQDLENEKQMLADAMEGAKDDEIEDAEFTEEGDAPEPDDLTASMLDWKLKMDEATTEGDLEHVGHELHIMEDGPLKIMLRSYYGTRLKAIRGASDGDSGQPDGGEAGET